MRLWPIDMQWMIASPKDSFTAACRLCVDCCSARKSGSRPATCDSFQFWKSTLTRSTPASFSTL